MRNTKEYPIERHEVIQALDNALDCEWELGDLDGLCLEYLKSYIQLHVGDFEWFLKEIQKDG